MGLDAILALPRALDRGIAIGCEIVGDDASELVDELGIEMGIGMGVRDGVPEVREPPKIGESSSGWSRKCEIDGETARRLALVG